MTTLERMGPLDAWFLYAEEDGVNHMNILSFIVLEGPPPPYEDLLELVASKLPQLPRYRQVVRTVPLQIGRPVWVDDANFDLQFHVRQTALAQPGDDHVLERLISRLMAQQFDRARPLWELWSVEGLTDGRWVLLGVDRFTAMVNPGESTIVAVGRTTERLVPHGRTISVVPTLTITLSFDHRVVDGAVGGAALGELAGLLEGGMTWRP